MADIIWPIDLPQHVLADSFQETRGKNRIESPVDQGRQKSRRRFTADLILFQIAMFLTDAQAVIFDTFYEETSGSGTLPFDWVHPRTQAAAECRFTGEAPVFARVDGYYRVTFQMLILP